MSQLGFIAHWNIGQLTTLLQLLNSVTDNIHRVEGGGWGVSEFFSLFASTTITIMHWLSANLLCFMYLCPGRRRRVS